MKNVKIEVAIKVTQCDGYLTDVHLASASSASHCDLQPRELVLELRKRTREALDNASERLHQVADAEHDKAERANAEVEP